VNPFISIARNLIHADVQVTKDLVPVVYHDFLVSETGTDAAMYNLSLSQVYRVACTAIFSSPD